MKLIKSTGCTAFHTRLDGIDITDLNEEELELLIDKLINYFKIEKTDIVDIIIDKYCEDIIIDKEPCDSCGDTITQYIINFDE